MQDSMKHVTENHLKGNYAEAYVTALLSAHCLVRPVAQGTDVGLDLYCESVKDNTPFLHFWLQVKSGDQCCVGSDGDVARHSFRVSDLRYWAAQPVPVFVALVPVETWPPDKEPRVYVVDLTRQLVEGILDKKLAKDGGEVTLRSDLIWTPGNPQRIRDFLDEVLPEANALLGLRDGVVLPEPTLRRQYVEAFSPFPVDRFQRHILAQIRRTAAFSILSLEKPRGENRDFRNVLQKVLEAFEGDIHWENFAARGLCCHAEGRFDEAIRLYERAMKNIQDDPKFHSAPIVRRLTDLIDQAERKSDPWFGFSTPLGT